MKQTNERYKRNKQTSDTTSDTVETAVTVNAENNKSMTETNRTTAAMTDNGMVGMAPYEAITTMTRMR